MTERERLEHYRRRGLAVDEDFELGISSVQRRLRMALWSALVLALALATLFLVYPTATSNARLRHRGLARPPLDPAPLAHRHTNA